MLYRFIWKPLHSMNDQFSRVEQCLRLLNLMRVSLVFTVQIQPYENTFSSSTFSDSLPAAVYHNDFNQGIMRKTSTLCEVNKSLSRLLRRASPFWAGRITTLLLRDTLLKVCLLSSVKLAKPLHEFQSQGPLLLYKIKHLKPLGFPHTTKFGKCSH